MQKNLMIGKIILKFWMKMIKKPENWDNTPKTITDPEAKKNQKIGMKKKMVNGKHQLFQILNIKVNGYKKKFQIQNIKENGKDLKLLTQILKNLQIYIHN